MISFFSIISLFEISSYLLRNFQQPPMEMQSQWLEPRPSARVKIMYLENAKDLSVILISKEQIHQHFCQQTI